MEAYNLLLLGYKPAQHITRLNKVGNYNTMVSIYICKHILNRKNTYKRLKMENCTGRLPCIESAGLKVALGESVVSNGEGLGQHCTLLLKHCTALSLY